MDFVAKSFNFEPNDRCIVIGEIGVNHNRDESLLFRLIEEGVAAGVDIIKLQRFVAAEEIATSAPSAQYQQRAGAGDNQLAMAQALELPDDLLVRAFERCNELGVGFLCTAFDHSSVDFVADRLGCRSVKVPSPEITNRPLLEHMAQKFDSLLVSTGASDLGECAAAVKWIRSAGDCEIALMHCLSEYPAPIDQANLRAIATMRACFDVPVGYSDHTEGIVAPIVAASLGAAMIEKHYTLDKTMQGPDHKASADLSELAAMTDALRQAAVSLGDGVKRPVDSERANRLVIRKSITCAEPRLEAGTTIEREMLGIKRPSVEGAVEPFDLDKIVGMKLTHEKHFDEPILWSDFR